jgi:hypothetical protein
MLAARRQLHVLLTHLFNYFMVTFGAKRVITTLSHILWKWS